MTHPILWNSNDPIHCSFAMQEGRRIGQQRRNYCREYELPATRQQCSLNLHLMLAAILNAYVVDDPRTFAANFAPGFWIGFSLFETQEVEAPF